MFSENKKYRLIGTQPKVVKITSGGLGQLMRAVAPPLMLRLVVDDVGSTPLERDHIFIH